MKGPSTKRERRFTPVMSLTRLLSLCPRQRLSTRVVERNSIPTTASTEKISLCVASLTIGAFATSPCRARTTMKEIILNLKVGGEEERKRTVLASFRKRTDILFHFN